MVLVLSSRTTQKGKVTVSGQADQAVDKLRTFAVHCLQRHVKKWYFRGWRILWRLEHLICDKVGHFLQVFKAYELHLLFERLSPLLYLMNPYTSFNISRSSSNTAFVKDETSTNTLVIHPVTYLIELQLGVYMFPLGHDLLEGRNKPYSLHIPSR